MCLLANREISTTVPIKANTFALGLGHQLKPEAFCCERVPELLAFWAAP
jgi:hypothetical protein